MKFLVVYYSETGNTKKVTEAIYEAIPYEKDLFDMNRLKDIEGYELIFFGFPVHAGKMPKKPAEFLKSHGMRRKIALFCTQGAPKDSEFALKALQYAKKQSPKAEVIGIFNCRGEVTQRILYSASKNPKFQSWAKSAMDSVGHPDLKDLEEAREFARKISNKVTLFACPLFYPVLF